MEPKPMEVLPTGRLEGKTTKSVQWVLEGREKGEERAIVYFSGREAMKVRREHGLTEHEAICLREADRHLRGRRPKVILEDAEFVLRDLLARQGLPLHGVTMTATPVEHFTDDPDYTYTEPEPISYRPRSPRL